MITYPLFKLPIIPCLAVTALSIPMLFSSCMFLRKELPTTQYLIGEAPSKESSSQKKSSLPLQVRRIQTALPYSQQEFVYRTGDTTFESDYYHQFLVPPSDMFTDATRSAVYRDTFAPASTSNNEKPPAVLEGQISSLYGDFREPEKPRAILQMQFILHPSDPARRPVIRQYTQAIPLSTKTPEGLVEAWKIAWKNISIQLQRDLKKDIL